MSSALRDESVLVVDDEPQVLSALADTLEENFRVFTASSPEEGIEILGRESGIAVILSDQRMPGRMGHEFLAEAREVCDATRVLITGYADIEAVVAAVNEGRIFGYISKPWDPVALRVAVIHAAEHFALNRELREREERFRQIAENIRDVFWITEAKTGQGIYISPAYEELWGRSLDELEAHPGSWMEAIHAEDRSLLETAHWEMMHNGRESAAEYRVVRPDGAVRWVRERMFPIRDASNRIYRIAGVAEDVTESKYASAKFQGLLEAAPDALVVTDIDGRIDVINSAAERLFGYSREELLGRPVEMLLAERYRQNHARTRAAFASGRKRRSPVAATENFALRKDGSEVPIEVSLGSMDSEKGMLITAAIRDITQRKAAEALIRETNQKLSALIQSAPVAICMLDRDSRVLMWNPAAEQLFGWSESELLGAPYPIDARKFQHLLEMESSGTEMASEQRRERKDGSMVEYALWSTVLRDPEGMPYAGLVMMVDIAERKAQEQKIARLTRIYAVLSGINSAIVRIHDRQVLFEEACRIAVIHGRFEMAWVLEVNAQAGTVRAVASDGIEADVALVDTLTRSTPDSTAAYQSGTVGDAIREKRPVYCNDLTRQAAAGMAREELVSRGYRSVISMPLLPGGECFGVLVLYSKEADFFDELELRLLTELAGDISFGLEYIRKEEQATYLAYYDPLTGLTNRAMFHERLGQFVDEAERDGDHLALLVLDIDRFKTINDTLGRNVGDALLCELAVRLRRHVEESSQIARISADQFALVFPNLKHADQGARLAEDRIADCFREPFRMEGQELRFTAKIGIALFPDDAHDADVLFRNAEVAVKKAKETGDRYLFYTQQMNERVSEKLNLENELRRALERSEFTLHYQPKVEANTGRIVGLEALIRWNHPSGRMVPPMQFIPLLEETGLILEVGEWAIDQAASDYREWLRADLSPPRVAVNVSTLQLKQQHFVKRVLGAISARGRFVHMDLEITESTIMENVEEDMSKLLDLKMAGLGIVVDDFGTGYSSLNYIARMPINALKIDRSFVVGMTSSLQSRLIVNTITSLAHALNLKVVAEGVDSEAQLEVLRQLQCDEIQGFLFCKPLPPGDVARVLRESPVLTPH